MHQIQGAIITRRTNSFIIAEAFNGSHKKRIEHGMNNATLHATAAMELVEKLAGEWCKRRAVAERINAPQCGQWIAGDMPKGDGFAFTYAGETNRSSGIEPRGFVQNCETNGKK